MRRALVSALVAPVLLLSACGDDEPEVVEPPAGETTEDSAETTEDDAMVTSEDDAMETTTEDDDADDATEGAADDDADDTTGDDDAGGESSGEGQAAADRAKEWLVAFVEGDEKVCNYMLDLSSEGPMVDSPEDMDMCKNIIPGMAGDMFDDEMAGIIGAIEIKGASVEGDTATITKDNFSEAFSEGFGEDKITLKKVDGEWYVDMNNSF